ncbi:MAG: NAD(P)/FAD-dependent oxidoreductase, partial [Clostridia bacterium]|nr:NAD(P)/FAD-dependent oxidoreductase [Clostridia bacterium]
DAKKVARSVKAYSIKVTGTMGFDASQVTKGGISVSDFNRESLESKLTPNLYACGEVLDVDGDCGGFNLKWAFASAFAICENIK